MHAGSSELLWGETVSGDRGVASQMDSSRLSCHVESEKKETCPVVGEVRNLVFVVCGFCKWSLFVRSPGTDQIDGYGS